MSSSKIVIAFDLYGTLLSTESIAKELAAHFGDEKATTIAALWRRYQLEYTWRINSMGIYKPFYDITLAALNHALAETSNSLDADQIENLMHAYDSLDTFPDVAPGLERIASDSSIEAYVFSNGSTAMVSASVNSSPSLSPHASVFKGVVTIEACQVFKPDSKVYEYLAKKVGKSGDMGSVWLVSGNPFDIVGALKCGLRAAWVNRAAGGWNDRLGTLVAGAMEGPTIIVKGVEDAVEGIKKWAKDH